MSSQSSEATVFHSEVRSLTSVIANNTYQIDIWLPPSYADSAKSFPTLYLLDSNLLFGAAANLVLPLIWGAELPELIIVGIGYEKLQSYDEWGHRRQHDFELEARPFLDFISSELIPFVEANYRTDPTDRAITGHSLGGYFVWYTLFHGSGLFQRYCAGSPGVGEKVIASEQQFAETHSALPANIAVVVGALEDDQVADLETFCTSLRGRNYSGLSVTLLVMDGESHGSVIARLMTTGWKTIYS